MRGWVQKSSYHTNKSGNGEEGDYLINGGGAPHHTTTQLPLLTGVLWPNMNHGRAPPGWFTPLWLAHMVRSSCRVLSARQTTSLPPPLHHGSWRQTIFLPFLHWVLRHATLSKTLRKNCGDPTSNCFCALHYNRHRPARRHSRINTSR